MRHRSPLLRLLAALFALTLVAAACADDDDGGDAAEPATTPTDPAPEMTDPDEPDPDVNGDDDIVDTAVAAGDFTTLATALEAADLIDTLKGDGPFTVFAPTDAAFEALPPGTLEELLEDPDALREVLLYHVVDGEVLAADVVDLDSATTLQGSDVTISVDGDDVRVGDALVGPVDIMASNGVIHVIDAVLLPPAS